MRSPTPGELRPLGISGLSVSAVTLGTSALGRADRVPDDRAHDVLVAALDGPLRSMDTGNNYGLSEERVGRALRAVGGGPPGLLLATKVDPAVGGTDFSGARVRASVRESLQRLGVDRLEMVHLHDPERISFAEAMTVDGPVRALLALQEAGTIGHLGVAGGPVRLLQQFVQTGHFEAVVTHNRYTLVDRSAGPLLDQCAEAGVGVFVAAPYGGGFLAGGANGPTTYCYRPATPQLVRARQQLAAACAHHGVELAAAALQFALRDVRVASVIAGVSSTAQLEQLLVRAGADIPEQLWSELELLVPPSDGWLGPDG